MTARAGLLVRIALIGSLLAGCGTSTRHTAQQPAPQAQPQPAPPPVVQLQLELPLVGLSSAPTVRVATTAPHPSLRGVVTPAVATVYMLSQDGARVAVNAGADGSFSVRPGMLPGLNTFKFTAARLG